MPTSSFTCPECDAVLRTSNHIPAGKKIKCPKCSTVFVALEEEGEVRASIQERPRPAGAVPRKRPPLDDEDELPPARSLRKGPPPLADDDDLRDEEEDRPLRKKKGKKKLKKAQSGGGLKVALIAGSVLLVLLGGFAVAAWVWPGFLKSGANKGTGNEELIAYAPAESNYVFGADLGALMDDPALGAGVGPGLSGFQQSVDLLRRIKENTGLEVKDLLGKTVIAFKEGKGNSGLDEPVVAIRTRKAFDQSKMAKSFTNSSSKRHEGHTYYTVAENLAPPGAGLPGQSVGLTTLFMPSDQIVIVSNMTEDRFKTVVASDGGKSRLTGHLESLYPRVKDGQVWGVGQDPASRSGGDHAARPGEPVAVAGMGRIDAEGLQAQAFFDMGSEAEAKKFGSTSKMQLGLGVALMPPQVKGPVNEAMKNLKIGTEGPVATFSSQVSRKSLDELLQGLQGLAGAMGGMPGMGGGPAPAPPSLSGQPPSRGGTPPGGGGRRGGRQGGGPGGGP